MRNRSEIVQGHLAHEKGSPHLGGGVFWYPCSALALMGPGAPTRAHVVRTAEDVKNSVDNLSTKVRL